MTDIIPNVFVPDTVADANAVNANFNYLLGLINSGTFLGYPQFLNLAGAPYNVTVNSQSAATANTAAINQAVQDAISAGGGTIYFPGGQVYVNGPIAISTGNSGAIIFQGASAGTIINQQAVSDMFDMTASQGQGIIFNALTITYNGSTSFTNPPICFSMSHASYVAVNNCTINDYPIGFITEGHCLQCGAYNSVFAYSPPNPNSNTYYNNIAVNASGYTGNGQVVFGGAQGYLINCIVRQQPIGSNGPTGCAGVVLVKPNETKIVANHISDWDYGILVEQGTQFAYLDNNAVQSYTTSLTIAPATSAGSIYAVWVSNNQFQLTQHSNNVSSGVIVSTTCPLIPYNASTNPLGANSNVEGINFVNNLIYNFGNAGIQIDGGSYINVHAGKCSQNATASNVTSLNANIALRGGTAIRLVGVDMSGFFDFLSSTPTAGYALALNNYTAAYGGAAVSNLWVLGCNLEGPLLGPLVLSSQGTHCFLVNCAGYNNLNTQVASLANVPANNTQFDATTIGSTPYLGPVLVCVNGGTVTNFNLSIDRSSLTQVATGLTSGAIPLACRQSMSISYSVAPTSFVVLGQ